jgi:hypothetical protein
MNEQLRYRHWTIKKRVMLFLFFAFVGFRLGAFLDKEPQFFYDEGFYSQIAKNIVHDGVFASRFYREWVPVEFAVGPSFLLPMAASYKLFGIGIWQSRLWSVCSTMGTVIALILLVSRFGNPLIGIPIITALLFEQLNNFRYAFGEPSAYLYFAWSLYLLLLALENRGPVLYLSSGSLLGLAIASKATVALFLGGGLLGCFFNYVGARSWSAKNSCMFVLGVITPLFGWLFIGGLSSGFHSFFQYNLNWAFSSSKVSALGALEPVIFHDHDIACIILSQFALVFVSGTLGRKYRSLTDAEHRWLAIVLGLWLAAGIWYAFFSIGWFRYAMAFNVLSWLLVGVFWPGMNLFFLKEHPLFFRGINFVSLLCTAVLLTLLGKQLWQISKVPSMNTDLEEMSAYIKREVPETAAIETYEWTIDAFIPNILRHPSNDEIVQRLTEQRTGQPLSPIRFWLYDVSYLLTGPFSQTAITGAYPNWLLENCARSVHEAGSYKLYKLGSPQCFREQLPSAQL